MQASDRGDGSVNLGSRLLEVLPQSDHADCYTGDPKTKQTRWNLIAASCRKLLVAAAEVCGLDNDSEYAERVIDVNTMHAKIGEVSLVEDFLSAALGKVGL